MRSIGFVIDSVANSKFKDSAVYIILKILIILLPFMLVFLKKSLKEKENMNRMPDFGGYTCSEKKKYSEEKKYERYGENKNDDYEGQMGQERAYESKQHHPSSTPVIVPNIAITNDELSCQGHSKGLGDPLRSDEVMKGIVWAEILGSPRARRPFGRR